MTVKITNINPVHMKAHLLSFTYSGLSISREIIRSFSPLRVYLPWGLRLTDYMDDAEIIVLYPPEALRPGVDVNLLIDEYVNRAQELGEKSRNEIIKRGNSATEPDESIRNIRAAILGSSSTAPIEKEMIIRWHMLLQLADRFEKQRKETDSMIKTLRKRPSPLLNNADLTAKALYPLEALEGMDAESFISESNIRQLLRAWHALFGGYTDEGDLLLTVDRYIYNFLREGYENLSSNSGQLASKVFKCKIPLLQDTRDKFDALNAIQAIFSDLKYKKNPSGLSDVLTDYEARYCKNYEEPHILAHIFLMNTNETKNEPLLRNFSDRIIIHADIFNPPD